MNKCKCITSTHGHLTGECSNIATKENNRYCEYCADQAAKELAGAISSNFSSRPITQIPKQLPQELLNEYSEVERKFINAVQPGADHLVIEESFNLWKNLYEKIIESQPDGVRYHKGGEVHNMGICKIYTLQMVEALHFFLLGYIEDLLSESVNTANQAPGAMALKNAFHISDMELTKIQECVQNVIKEKGVVQNPQDVLNNFTELKMYGELIKRVKKISLLIEPDKYSSIGDIPDKWEQRVFIGGDYESISSLDLIIRPVVDFGFVPIIAKEFKSSLERIHHDSLLLLHNCKYAIFDVSGKGGHMMEAERTLDYGTETLFVCDKREASRVSAMLSSLGEKYKIHYFENRSELKKHISDFLGQEG